MKILGFIGAGLLIFEKVVVHLAMFLLSAFLIVFCVNGLFANVDALKDNLHQWAARRRARRQAA